MVIIGCAIVSADGMLADSSGVMPPSLKFDADQRFFNDTLEGAGLIVHGRNSFEDQPNSARRRRIVLTRRIAALAGDPGNPKAILWNPAGASFAEACAHIGFNEGRVAIIGGTDVFGMFLDRYDTFFLSQAPHVRLPGGVPVFPGVPGEIPQAILARHGLTADATQTLDAANDVTLTPWRRSWRPFNTGSLILRFWSETRPVFKLLDLLAKTSRSSSWTGHSRSKNGVASLAYGPGHPRLSC